VEVVFQRNVFDGHLFLFINKRRDRVKALWWEEGGLVIWYKRLERGGFELPRDAMEQEHVTLEDWGKLIGDIPSATAILDRFLHHAEIITITGRSYRLRNQGRQDGQANSDQATPKEEKRPRKGPPQAPAGE
jgi:hypothetical protein